MNCRFASAVPCCPAQFPICVRAETPAPGRLNRLRLMFLGSSLQVLPLNR